MTNEQNILQEAFFSRDTCKVAESLLGKIIRKKSDENWLSAQIIEVEAYYIDEKGSHASLGFTPKRRALFMPPGTIYMYYARGKDSLNISCEGKGNAVLIKSGIPYLDETNGNNIIKIMQSNNPLNDGKPTRSPMKLCSGQTILCKSLGITVKEWDQNNLIQINSSLKMLIYNQVKSSMQKDLVFRLDVVKIYYIDLLILIMLNIVLKIH